MALSKAELIIKYGIEDLSERIQSVKECYGCEPCGECANLHRCRHCYQSRPKCKNLVICKYLFPVNRPLYYKDSYEVEGYED